MVTARVVCAAALALGAIACSVPVQVTTVTQMQASVDITPPSLSLEVGSTRQLVALVRDSNGGAIIDAALQWSSQNPAVASVTSSGLVMGESPGSTRVEATAGPVTASVPVQVTTVTQDPPATVSDLRVTGTTTNSVTLQWTEVSDGAGGPADYAIVYGRQFQEGVNPAFVTFEGTSVGVTATGTVSGLQAGTSYQFVAVAYRGVGSDALVSHYSNDVRASTQGAAGQAPLFSDGFESGGLSSGANGVSWGGGTRTAVTTTNPLGGSRSLEFSYGPDGGGADSFSEQRFSFPRTGQIWIEHWLHVPANYRHRLDNPSNNKLFRLFSTPDDGTFSLTLETVASGNALVSGTDRFKSESGGLMGIPYKTEGTANVIGPDASYPIQIGRWTRVRIHFRGASSPTTSDGRVEVWANDRLVKALDWDFWPTKGSGPVRIDRGYLMGWANSGFSERTVFHIDDFKLWTSDPGW